MFVSRFMPCQECGESLDQLAWTVHRCDRERVLDFRMFGLRESIAAFEERYRAYLRSRQGHFEAWLAARQVRRRR